MSFTQSVADELRVIRWHKTCCKKAALCGLLFGAQRLEGEKAYVAIFNSDIEAVRATELIDAGFSTGEKTAVVTAANGGHRVYKVNFSSRALTGVIFDLDSAKKRTVAESVGFRCPECEAAFLAGVFLALATVSRPKSGYHMEIKLPTKERADALAALLEECISRPSVSQRQSKWGVYYKSNASIADVLYFIGAHSASFDVANLAVERDIINRENRATNCVTSNISRTVAAAVKHTEAIRYLMSVDKMHLLGEDLEYTARLRAENHEATLLELAHMHVPPISKSGLNSRLTRILAIADEQRAENKDKKT